MKTLKIQTTNFNEVSPKSISSIIEAGGRLIKSELPIGVFILEIGKDRFYSNDEIIINNVRLPLSINGNYDCELIINLC